jgi:hypothetical protein
MSDVVMKNDRVLFVVIYRTGGPKMCMWKRMHGAFNLKEAEAQEENLERSGYKTLLTPLDYFEEVGMPVGWDAESVDWKNDSIEYRENETFWTSHKA